MKENINFSQNHNKKFIFVSGANGFTGRFVCLELKKRKIEFIALIRPYSDISWMKRNNINFRFADLNKPNQLKIALKDCNIFLNIKF